MRALSLTQPWASLMALDEKRYETRGPTFPRRHKGDMAIVASKGFPRDCRDLVGKSPFYEALRGHVNGQIPIEKALPLGMILCVVEVVGYASADEVGPRGGEFACAAYRLALGAPLLHPAPHEHDFGDYSPGRTIIITRNLRVLREPVPVAHMEKGVPTPGGALGLFDLSPACEAAVRAQLAVATADTRGAREMSDTRISQRAPRDGREWDNQCARCGSQMVWWECQNCDDGYDGHDCGEDCCACADPEPNVRCGICGGARGWYVCASSSQWCATHPMEGRADVERGAIEWFTLDDAPAPTDPAK